MINKKIYSVDDAEKLDIDEVVELYKKYINPNQAQIFSSLPYGKDIFSSADGVFIYTSNKKKILDFTGGLGVLGLGHNHKNIISRRIKFQEKNGMEVHKIVFSQYMAALSNNMASLLPDKLNKSFFLNSGAEAIEAAIKVCYKSFESKRKYILYSNKSYHGKLIGSGSISGSYKKDKQFPLMENCVSFKFNDPDDLEKKIKDLESKGKVYSVIVEPYSASMLTACSDSFVNKLNDLRNQYGFRIVFDEVFTGWYKSEKLFYFQNFKNQIIPDAITLSKSLGGGKSSISCVVVNDDIYNKAYGNLSDTFLHTTTYNGFAEECVTALESTNLFATEEFKNKVKNLSSYLKKKLLEIKNKHQNKISEVKGTGILNGIVFDSFYTEIGKLIEKFPSKFISDKSFFLKKLTATVVSCELYEKHNILTAVSDSSNSNHLCVSPPLIINNNEVDLFFDKLDEVLTKGVSFKSLEIVLNFLKSKIK
tara:strand:+ start:1404 stop:2837 length:1434 start_codon:yes stop_codon:yes gene_type:complete